jgi:AraC-like DNA-binding protein
MYTVDSAPLRPRAIRRPSACRPNRFGSELTSLLQSLGIAYAPDDFGATLPWCEAGRNGLETGLQIHEAVELAKGFVEAHAGDDIDLDSMAQEAGISKFHLVRLFREAEGTTPWAYVRAARIRRAKELLEEDLPLVDVALQSGFYDQSHFNRAFREAEGKTPGQYREERKNIQD